MRRYIRRSSEAASAQSSASALVHQKRPSCAGGPLRETLGGDGRIRTGDGGFADLCLATWPRRRWLVPRRGFEPLRPKARPPQDRVSTYSTTSAWSTPPGHLSTRRCRRGHPSVPKGHLGRQWDGWRWEGFEVRGLRLEVRSFRVPLPVDGEGATRRGSAPATPNSKSQTSALTPPAPVRPGLPDGTAATAPRRRRASPSG